MKVINFDKCYLEQVVSLWNKNCNEKQLPYKLFTEDEFLDKFCNNKNYDDKGTFLMINNEKVIGFANGICKKQFLQGEDNKNTPGYLTFILVDKKYRNKGYGSVLLQSVENYFKQNSKTNSDIIFFNPINLEWIIPNTNEHDHPNSPGVDIKSNAYNFLKDKGYATRTVEVSMYLPLDKFDMPKRITTTKENLKTKNINIQYYKSTEHKGFNELFDNLKNEDWRDLINQNLLLDKPYPILIASCKGKICGFAGPIKVQKSGRGWFAGIGVDPNYQGLGIGTCLFYELCESFKNEGAGFMSLFTGEENKAKKIYEGAGFREVKKWAVMRKEIN